MNDLEEILQDQRDWMREVEEQRYREAKHITAGTPDQEQHHNDNVHTPPPLIPLKHAHDIVNSDRAHITEFEGYKEFNNGTNNKEPNCDVIELLTLELTVPRVMNGTWAEEMDREHKYITDSEYI
jgi:hypothetical protein